VGRVGVCMLCACDSEDREHGVGAGYYAVRKNRNHKPRRICRKGVSVAFILVERDIFFPRISLFFILLQINTVSKV
jgi:hypothetical protein